jgi:hypothetical protein
MLTLVQEVVSEEPEKKGFKRELTRWTRRLPGCIDEGGRNPDGQTGLTYECSSSDSVFLA